MGVSRRRMIIFLLPLLRMKETSLHEIEYFSRGQNSRIVIERLRLGQRLLKRRVNNI